MNAAEQKSDSMIITCSSDRGLCGSIHSSVAKLTLKQLKQNYNSKVIVLGDKAKPQIVRSNRDNILYSFNQIGKDIPNFQTASAILSVIEKNDLNLQIIFNRFKSLISYESTQSTLFKNTDKLPQQCII